MSDLADILVGRGLDKDFDRLAKVLETKTTGDVEKALAQEVGVYSFDKLLAFLSPAAVNYLEPMAQAAERLTIQRFGRTIQLYAPLYVSNFCTNSCLYCGFNRTSDFERTRLSIDQAVAEAEIIAAEGFRHILLVSGEDKSFVTVDYLCDLAGKLRETFSSISVEIYQLTGADYERLLAAGIDGVTLYQETYNRNAYSHFHPAGRKADYDERLTVHDATAGAGMRRLGIGVLLGLCHWRVETLALAEHARYLMKKYWRSQVSFSFPRLRPAFEMAEKFEHLLSDSELVQMMLSLRLVFADAGLVLSTREPAQLRDKLIRLGITRISAGSKTNPGGYSCDKDAVEQFEVADARSAAKVARMIESQGREPVWKDWDAAFCGE